MLQARIRDRVRHQSRAFTLIELLVVILIIAILAAVALPSFLNQTTKAVVSGLEQQARHAYTAAKADAIQNTPAGTFKTGAGLVSVIAGDEPQLANTTTSQPTAGGPLSVADSTSSQFCVTAITQSGTEIALSAPSNGATTIADSASNSAPAGCPAGGWYNPQAQAQHNTYEADVKALGPVAYYPLQDSAGSSSAADASGNGYNMSLTGSGITFGSSGTTSGVSAAQFTGAGALLGPGPLAAIMRGNYQSFTLEEWVRPSSLSQSAAFISAGDAAPSYGGQDLFIGAGACPASTIAALASGQATGCGSWSFPDTTSWHMVDLVDNGTTDTLYVDGNVVAFSSASGCTPYGSASCVPYFNPPQGNPSIGGIQGSPHNYFSGSVQDAAFYAKTLTQAQIQSLYNAQP